MLALGRWGSSCDKYQPMDHARTIGVGNARVEIEQVNPILTQAANF